MRKRKSLPKHVREVVLYLTRLGAAAIEVATHHRYILSFRFGEVMLRLNLPLSAGSNAVEQACGAIRREMRHHGLPVPV